MKIAFLISQYLLALIYVVFGLNFFIGFLELPKMGEEATAFMGLLYMSKFLLVIKVIEVAAGLLLAANFFSRVALLVLMPISVGILLFHLLLAKDNPVMAIVIVLLNLVALLGYKDDFKEVLKVK